MGEDTQKIKALMEQEGHTYDFINVKSGYACLLRRSPTTGAWCGYVELPKDHPFHDLDYTDIENMENVRIDVHGGLTFSQQGVFGFDTSHYGDYYIMGFNNTDMMGMFATQMVELHERTMAGDKEAIYRTKEYVINECNSMAEQFFSYKDMVIPKKLEEKKID